MDSVKIKSGRQGWLAPASKMAKNTLNPIRRIVDGMKMTPNPEKEMISLSIGQLSSLDQLCSSVYMFHVAYMTSRHVGIQLHSSSWIGLKLKHKAGP